MRCFQGSWVLVFIRKTRRRLHDYFWLGAGTGLFFGTSKLLACLQPNDDDFGFFFFWLANIPYVDYLPAVVLFFSTWQLPIFLLTRSRLTLRLKQNEELKAAFSTFLILDDEEQARLCALHVLDQDITMRPPTADMQCMEQSRLYLSTYR